MSADDGFVVGPLDPDSNEWGLWHYFLSGGLDSNDREPDSRYNSQSDALQAAYNADESYPSEYGVCMVFEYPVIMEGF